MRESELEKKVGQYCRKRALQYYKFSSPSRRGVPDRIVLGKGGQIMFLELKALGKKPTKLQLMEMRALTVLGFTALWVDNYDDAVRVIEGFFE